MDKQSHSKVEMGLDMAAAIFALLAAIYWFLSSCGKVPPQISYYDETPKTDPYYAAMVTSAHLNAKAAFFSGISALCMFFRVLYAKQWITTAWQWVTTFKNKEF